MISSKKNSNYYNSISELPLINWWKLQENKDYGYILKTYRDIISEKELQELDKIYSHLMEEYVSYFGFDEHLILVLEKQISIAKLKAEVINGNKSKLTMIEIAELELSELIRGVKGMNFNEAKAAVEKFMGFRIDPYHTTVLEYYSYIKLIDGKKN